MTRLLAWWMSAPIDFKLALAGFLTPYVLMGILIWVVKH